MQDHVMTDIERVQTMQAIELYEIEAARLRRLAIYGNSPEADKMEEIARNYRLGLNQLIPSWLQPYLNSIERGFKHNDYEMVHWARVHMEQTTPINKGEKS